MPPYYPGGLEVFTDTVVPILRERGLFRTEYSGTTLRDHFGLPRPESRFARRPVGVR
ncbi:nitrilotriacetate monooxygenase component A (NTA monooxygenase component A) (NTA-MO A) [Mycobacteroides abscessus subsp. abscessus]|nr:nitrilotriacetate monooxygenase component A (NTA monooxygenase component A) (NTA-MO A) [Mycobacteroides abscessus subsp. abscessus]